MSPMLSCQDWYAALSLTSCQHPLGTFRATPLTTCLRLTSACFFRLIVHAVLPHDGFPKLV